MLFVYLLALALGLITAVLTIRFLWMVPTELREIKIFLHLIEKTLDK